MPWSIATARREFVALSPDGAPSLTAEPADIVRFSRKQDARRFAMHLLRGGFDTGGLGLFAAPPPPEDPA